MLSGKLDPSKLSDMLTIKAMQRRRPLYCTFELTYRCSFACPMCYIRMTDQQAAPFGRHRTVEEWLDMGRQLQDAGVMSLTLTGGECTTYPGFGELYRGLAQLGLRIHLMTNGYAYSSEVIAAFEEYPPQAVSITLYGGSNETYHRITGRADGLDRVLENIRFFQKLGCRMGLTFTIVRENVLDYPKIGQIAAELGIPYKICMDIVPHAFDPAFSNALGERLSPAERACVSCCRAQDVDKAIAVAGKLSEELKHFSLPVTEETDDDIHSCIASFEAADIYWNGDMNTCLSLRGSGDYKPFEIGFETAWQQLQANRDKVFVLPPACGKCGLRKECPNNCPGRNHEGTGDIQTPDPYICRTVWLTHLYRQTHDTSSSTLPQEVCR